MARLVWVVCIAYVLGKLPEDDCKQKGFTDQLLCSSCSLLTTYLPGYSELHRDCTQCCTSDEAEQPLYTEAVLTYNPKYITAYAALQEFIKLSLDKYPNLRVVSEARLYPKLLLFSADGRVTEEQIRHWTREELEEFLNKRLEKVQEKPASEGWFW